MSDSWFSNIPAAGRSQQPASITSSSPEQPFSISLNYGIAESFSPSPSPSSPSPRRHSLQREISSSLPSPTSSIFDDLIDEEEEEEENPTEEHVVVSSSSPFSSNPQSPLVVDLTYSPPQQRRQPILSRTEAFPSQSTFYQESNFSTSESMDNRRTRLPGSMRPPMTSTHTSTRSTHPDISDPAPASRTFGESSSTNNRTSSNEEHRHKRRRVETSNQERDSATTIKDNSSSPVLDDAEIEEVEEVDLTDVNDSPGLDKALSKQREDAVKAALQSGASEDDEGRTALTSYKCPICMDVLEDATSTICGHLFCHKCIVDTLRFSEIQRSEDSVGKAKGTCPVCRKPMIRSDKADRTRTLVPLALKLQVVPRVKDKGKGKAVERDGSSQGSASVLVPS